MKTLFIIVISFCVVSQISAQRGGFRGGRSFHYSDPVHINVGWHWDLINYGYYPGWYGMLYTPYPYGAYNNLTEEIENIKMEYKQQIRYVRHDHSIPRKKRKEKIGLLKQEKYWEIVKAKEKFYNYIIVN